MDRGDAAQILDAYIQESERYLQLAMKAVVDRNMDEAHRSINVSFQFIGVACDRINIPLEIMKRSRISRFWNRAAIRELESKKLRVKCISYRQCLTCGTMGNPFLYM